MSTSAGDDARHHDAYELRVNDFVPYVNPADYSINDFQGVNPADYFVTSGDAVQKATFMEGEMWAAAGAARRRFGGSKNTRHRKFQADLWSAAGKCRALVNKLKSIRGQAVFLETEWVDHKLYCRPKNPRAKTDSAGD